MALPRARARPRSPSDAADPEHIETGGVGATEPVSASFRPTTTVGGEMSAPRPHHAPASAPSHDARPRSTLPARFPRQAVVGLFVFGAMSFVVGWYTAFNGLRPGVFLASDIGVPSVLLLLARAIARVLNEGIRDPGLSRGTGSIPKAAAWSLGVYWFFATMTNVTPLAIGVGGGILAYQVVAARARIARAGFNGSGPGLRLALWTIGAYGVWLGLRVLVGPTQPGLFDLVSAGGVFAFSIVMLVRARNAARVWDKMVPDPELIREAKGGLRTSEKKVALALVFGYLFFNIFISSQIPYGPIIEWLLVCVGVLLFAIGAADRVGVVPTRRSLPDPSVRAHVQRVLNLPDRRLEETQAHITAFVERGTDRAWIHQYFEGLFREAGVPAEDMARHLAPFTVTGRKGQGGVTPVAALGLESRARLVRDLVEVVRRHRRRRPSGTGTGKTTAGVQAERPALGRAAPS